MLGAECENGNWAKKTDYNALYTFTSSKTDHNA